jgi:hypothetical protein
MAPSAPDPPAAPEPLPPAESGPTAAWATLAPGQQLLIYTPDGPLGGTFTCVHCRAQAWQPDLLGHAQACPGRRADPLPGRR